MMACWSAGIKSKGGFSDELGHVMDFRPTFMELGGAAYPETFKGHAIPYTGVSLVTAFKNKKAPGHEVLYNEHYNARYIRSGEWKLVSYSNDTTWHLYRIAKDETELNDLSGQYPEMVKQLSEKWRRWGRYAPGIPETREKRIAGSHLPLEYAKALS